MIVILRKFATLKSEVKSKGAFRMAKIYADRLAVFTLSEIYKFPASWHPPTSMRQYRKTVAGIVNALKPDIVCEVGCGLCSILSRVRAPYRHGYDIDPGVIRAARLLRGSSLKLQEGGLSAVGLKHIDVLILVNWIHEVSPHDLEKELSRLLPITRYLVLDAIDPDNSYGYRYKHDFSFLEERTRQLSVTRHPGEGRSFQLFEVIR
jgi:hypothetical protein